MTICCNRSGADYSGMTGKTWEQYISERILRPLEMKTTH